MTEPLIYPGADHTTQWVGKGSVTMPMNHVKWVVHTTEGTSWPPYTYDGVPMGSAPTLTYDPWQHKWRQHFEMNQSARALESPGSTVINRLDVIQTEIICICNQAEVAKYGHAANTIDDQAVNDLGDFGAWLVKEWGMKEAFYPSAVPWPAYDHGCTRMGYDNYKTFSGVLGHMAVPYNSHLDPGDLPLDRIKARMLQGAKPLWPQFRETSPAVGAMVTKLAANGYFLDGHRDRANYYGAWTRGAIKRLQLAYDDTKVDPDGLIGALTWAHIEALPDAPPPPPPGKIKYPMLYDAQQKVGDAIRSIEAVEEAHPLWKFAPQDLAVLKPMWLRYYTPNHQEKP